MSRTLVLVLLALSGCATTTSSSSTRPSAPPPRIAPAERVASVRELAEQAARRHGLDPSLVLGVIQVESGFRPETRSSAGALGLMQLMPRTARALARRLGHGGDPDVLEPGFNLEAGCLYLSLLVQRFDGDLELALAAYNAGPNRVASWRASGQSLPDYSRRYVDSVLAARRVFAEGGSPKLAAHAAHAGLSAGRGPEPDRGALRDLLRKQQERYAEAPASQPASRPVERADEGLEGLPASQPAP